MKTATRHFRLPAIGSASLKARNSVSFENGHTSENPTTMGTPPGGELAVSAIRHLI